MFKKSIILLCFLSGMFCAQAKVVMPKIFSDNMVLQQSTDARIWGYATANARVSLKTSWSSEKIVTKADAAGKWSTSIKTPKATYDPQTITISDGPVCYPEQYPHRRGVGVQRAEQHGNSYQRIL
jgi:sialate O-acetylesterase